MNEEIVRTLLRIKQGMGDKILSDSRRVDAFLQDMLAGKYAGERKLLLLLMGEDLPRKAKQGRFDGEAALVAEARNIHKTHFVDEDMAYRALLTWRYIARADTATAAAGRVDAALLRAMAGPSGASAPHVEPAPPLGRTPLREGTTQPTQNRDEWTDDGGNDARTSPRRKGGCLVEAYLVGAFMAATQLIPAFGWVKGLLYALLWPGVLIYLFVQ